MKQFNPTKNRSAIVSNEVLELHRYKLSLNAQKLLYGLAQSVDHTVDMFDSLEIDIHGLFKYLDIESHGERYNKVYNAFDEIGSNPLKIKVNAKKWRIIPWVKDINFDEGNSKYVTLKFTDEIKPFLLNLSGYVKIQGKYICSLGSAYATWLYPLMKMISEKYYGQHIITIQRLKEYTFTDDPKEHPSYNTVNAAANNFLRKVIGVTKNSKTNKYEIVKSSPLWEINEKTDVSVSVEVLKTGRKYDRICFYVQSKYKKIDKGSVDKTKFVNEIPKTTGLNPISKTPLKDVYQFAKASGMSVQDYCNSAGYYIQGDFVYKRFKKPSKGKKSTGQLSLGGIINEQFK